MTPALFSSLTLRSVTAKNRIMVSPMCQYSAPNGVPGDWHFVHLATRAIGGAGIVMTEATAVRPDGRITPFDLGLWNDEQEQAFARIAQFVSEHGAVPGIQLAHAGRKASHSRPWERRRALGPSEGGWPVVGPSPLAWEEGDLVPKELTHDDIHALFEAFRESAKRALRAGFRILELHAAHGYLLHSFLSPLSNQRHDDYGGSFENRCRFLLECVAATRAVWPEDLPLFVRISASDFVEGGWSIDDSIRLSRWLAKAGVDLVDCSAGGASPAQKVVAVPHYQVAFASQMRRAAGMLTAAVGMISEPMAANQIIETGEADLVVLGRILLWHPYWPLHAAKTLGLTPPLPIQYARADGFSGIRG
ncbi:MAG: NADH:flavin oxidoreductase/NADH oxidase [Opitutaceae bacterium]|nr:NADH:flavin oxidoreductase/NADH oxidase [Opitutaceae bacterium]